MMKTKKTQKPTIVHKVLIVAAAILMVACAVPAKARAVQQQDDDTTTGRTVVIAKAEGLHTTDSMDYVINGKKSTRTDFEKIKYSGIMSVNWVSAENAAKIFDNGGNGHSVLFVTTKNSEAGKKILAKVNTVENSKGQVFNKNDQGMYAIADGKFTGLNVVSDNGYNAVATDEPMIISAGGNSKAIARGSSSPAVYSISSSNSAGATISGSGRTYKRLTTVRGDAYAVTSGGLESGSELSDLKNKLIIINDKEAAAADLKKLSAFDIDKMSFKDDDYTRHQYGDKAKNGVVYIYTKKATK